MFGDIFKGKTILVTGHTGFKGSWLSIWLLELGAHVVGYALEPYTPKDNFVVTHLQERMPHIEGDLRDHDHLLSTFKKHQPEIVFHLAAQAIVRESYINPKDTYDTNVGGTVNVLECCRVTDSVRTIISITSDKCYENREIIWGYRETDPMGGSDPYSSSKGCAELVTQAYRRSFFNPDDNKHNKALSSVRAGNVIGGGDWQKDRLIPDAIRALENGDPIPIRNPQFTRPWQHVLEPLSGYLTLAAKMEREPGCYTGAWNFGPESRSVVPVCKVADLVVREWGAGKWVDVSGQTDQPHEAGLLNLDIAKAKTLLDWHPVWNLEEAVSAAVDWYKSYDQGEVYDFCVGQIRQYTEKNTLETS